MSDTIPQTGEGKKELKVEKVSDEDVRRKIEENYKGVYVAAMNPEFAAAILEENASGENSGSGEEHIKVENSGAKRLQDLRNENPLISVGVKDNNNEKAKKAREKAKSDSKKRAETAKLKTEKGNTTDERQQR